MAGDDSDEVRSSFEAAVRSFTASEVALGEFVAVAQRFRSAAESFERGHEVLELSREPLATATATLERLASDLQQTTSNLRSTTELLVKLDPDRFWATYAESDELVKSHAAKSAASQARAERILVQIRVIAIGAVILCGASLASLLYSITR